MYRLFFVSPFQGLNLVTLSNPIPQPLRSKHIIAGLNLVTLNNPIRITFDRLLFMFIPQ